MSTPESRRDPAHSAEHDLRHFLRLALNQLRHRIKQVEAQTKTSTERPDSRALRLRLLEELIKEQVPNEDSGSAAGPTR